MQWSDASLPFLALPRAACAGAQSDCDGRGRSRTIAASTATTAATSLQFDGCHDELRQAAAPLRGSFRECHLKGWGPSGAPSAPLAPLGHVVPDGPSEAAEYERASEEERDRQGVLDHVLAGRARCPRLAVAVLVVIE